MAMLKVTKEKVVVEDIALGVSTVEQSRGTVSELGGHVLPYDSNKTVNDEIDLKESILDNDAKLALKADINGNIGNIFKVATAIENEDSINLSVLTAKLLVKADLAYVNTELALKSSEDNTLLKDGTSPDFTPVSYNQPATKKYIDDLIIDVGAGDMLKSTYDIGNTGVVDSTEGVGNPTGPLGKSSSEQVMRLSQLNVIDCNILETLGIWVGTDVANAPTSGMIGLEQLAITGTKVQRCYSFLTGLWYDREWNGTVWSGWAAGAKLEYVVQKSGDSMTGALAFNNNIPIYLKSLAGIARTTLIMTSSDKIEIGNANHSATAIGDWNFVSNPTSSQVPIGDSDLTRKDYVDAADLLKLDLAGGTVTGQIKGIAPIADEDLARKDYVDVNIFKMPAGVTFDFAGATAPDKSLPLGDTEYAKTTYPELYAAIGDIWATTGGRAVPAVGNFRVPPQAVGGLGLYNRGVGATNGGVGTYEEDVFKSHNHGGVPTNASNILGGGGSGTWWQTVGNSYLTGDPTETRPRSLTVLKCIWTGQ